MFRSLQVLSWPQAEIKRDRFAPTAIVVPYVCPNCMAEGTAGYRTAHNYFLSNTTHYQTFWYCQPCLSAIRHESGTSFLKWLAAIATGIGIAALLAQSQIDPTILAVLSLAAAIGAGAIVVALRRMGKPLPAGGLGRRPVAYYTGQSFGGFGTRDIYRARRPEWLNLLVRANPDKATDESYSALTGQARPAMTKEKPF